MARSAPEVSFSVTSINYGTIDVGSSSPKTQYSVYQGPKTAGSVANSTSWAEAINMSISFKESHNASEARQESWVRVSTVSENAYVESVGGIETYLGSLVAGKESAIVRTLVSVNADAVTAGRVGFFLHHRYQYTA